VRMLTRSRLATIGALGVLGAGVMATGAVPVAAATGCSAVDVAFARGTFDPGIVGTPFDNALKRDLPGKSVSTYSVNYAAGPLQLSAGAGATDMTNHVVSVAARCPATKFVLGGYSQGASVTDIAIGIHTFLGAGKSIPTNLAPRVKAVVVFGNPLALFGTTIARASTLYGPKSDSFCNSGDPVCANGFNILAHLAYGSNGSATKGAAFAAQKVNALF
jgi:cutinase